MTENHLDPLPEDWREAYYNTDIKTKTRDDGPETDYTLVTAVYEHPRTAVKVVVRPHPQKGPINTNADNTNHEVATMYPVYEDLGIPQVFRKHVEDLRPLLNSIVPEVHPWSHSDEELPNHNAGPYLNRSSPHDGADHLWSVTESRWTEPDFDWESLPDAAIDNLLTLKQMPYDYRYILDNAQTLSTVKQIAREAPDLVEQPYPVHFKVGKRNTQNSRGNASEELIVTTDISLGSRLIERVNKYLDYEAIAAHKYEPGTRLATVQLNFQFTSFPYDPDIVDIKLHGPGKAMKTLRGRLFRAYS